MFRNRQRPIASLFASLILGAGAMLAAPGGTLADADNAAAMRPLDAEDAFEMVMGDDEPEDAALDRASTLLDEASKREPKNAKWKMGRAQVAFHRGDGEKAVDLCEEAISLEPNNADWRYRLGNACFVLRINEVGFLSKGTVASKGKAAYEKAAELDPNHVEARVGLVMFYANAPGIAGGSDKKARETAEELLKIPGGGYMGSMILASMAAKDKKWDEMNERYAQATAFATTPAERAGVQCENAQMLLRQKDDPSAALALARQIPMTGERIDSMTWYMIGESERELGDDAAAIEAYRKVLEINPDAQNTRVNLGACLEATGDLEGALASYEEYLVRFPEGSRADEAKKGAKKVRKELDKRNKSRKK